MKEIRVTSITGDPAKKIAKVLDEQGILIYRPTKKGLDVLTEVQTKEDILQHSMNKVNHGHKLLEHAVEMMNEGYEDYKKNHPDFKEFVERELEGKK